MKPEDRRKGRSGRKPYTNNVQFGLHKMVEERLKRSLSQRQLAEMTGVSRSTYTKIETGLTPGSKDFWEKISVIFGRSKEDLT